MKRFGVQEKSIVSNSWLTTFGDLLTLLLCFFVCIVSMTPLGETGNAKTASNIEKSSSGTGIAGVQSMGSEVELLFSEADYAEPEGERLTRVHSLAQSQLVIEDSSIEEARIETCFGGVELYEGESWHQSIERSLALRRQLLDAGVQEEAVTIRTVGPWCGALTGNKNALSFVSRIVLQMEQVVHG